MVILSLFNRKSEISVELKGEEYSGLFPSETRVILYQIYLLSLRGFLIDMPPPVRAGGGTLLSPSGPVNIDLRIAPKNINPTELCKRYYSIMELEDIPIEELEAIAYCLRS